ncbi:hypothetical protein JK363_30270 [Streptomyces sp. 205]|uniref:Uncharacterized protein n=1 Tax=Streptomyces coffeae TaxID=621382 RepID=A0ABS1NLD0_9ACTN|nr:hypothetical protein [Streptomyces coffeae]
MTEPGQDSGAFLGDEDVDLAGVGHDAFEGDEPDAAPEGEAVGVDLGPVVDSAMSPAARTTVSWSSGIQQ